MGGTLRQSFTAPPVDPGDTIPILQEERQPVSAPAVYREPLGSPIAFPLLVAFVHITIVSVAAIVAFRFFESTSSSAPFVSSLGEPEPLTGWTASLIEPLRHWDGLWYRLVADRGYGFHEANAAFWPAFPLSMRGLSRITGLGFDLSGFLIANASFALALILLYRLIGLDFSEKISRKSLWALALFPTSLFFTAVYTESLFLLLSVACLLSARKGKWWLAGILGALAALTRSYGVFLFLPMLVLLIQQYGFYLRELFPKLFAVAMPGLGPAFFAIFLERELGNWKAFIDVQSMWNRTFAWPWETMRCAIDGCTLTLTQYGNTSDKQVDGADWSWVQQLRADFSLDLISSELFRKTVADSDTLELTATVSFLRWPWSGWQFSRSISQPG